MINDQISPEDKRRNEAIQVFKEHPGVIAPEIQTKILAQQVVLGMAPYDAHLAAGAFVFKVIADASRWKGNVNPYKVMWAQSLHPDNSEIWMTFANETQYPGEGVRKFKVCFNGGKVLTITKL
jgi:hypothetical protein